MIRRIAIAALLAPAGVSLAHAVGYHATAAPSVGHGHLPWITGVGGLAAVAALLVALASSTRRTGSPHLATILRVQLAAMAALEGGERIVAGGDLGAALAAPEVLLALLAQVAVGTASWLVVVTAQRLAHRAVTRLASHRPTPGSRRRPAADAPTHAWLRHAPILRRGPPLLPAAC